MKFRTLVTALLLSSTMLTAGIRDRGHAVDAQALLEKAEALDHYATLSREEMIARTNEIYTVIRSLHRSIAARGAKVTPEVRQKVLEHIKNYQKAEQQTVRAK